MDVKPWGKLFCLLFIGIFLLNVRLSAALSWAIPESSISMEVTFVDSEQQLGTVNNWDVQLIDINQDGSLDAYFEGAIWLNDDQGYFIQSDLSFGPPDRQTWFGDMNGDGYVDAICDNYVFLNNGQNHFPDKNAIPSDIDMLYAELADLNNDGLIDIIAASATEDRVLINDGSGNFINTGITLGGWGQCRYAIGDINNDGFTDIYAAIPHMPPPTMRATPNLFWLGDSETSFNQIQHDDSPSESRDVVIADFDADEDLDLFVASGVGAGKVFINDGEGTFENSGQEINAGFHATDAQTADLDNDGDLDLFIANGKPGDSGQPNTIWLNDGTGQFSDSGLRLGHLNSLKIALGDLNNDGRIDVMVANVDLQTNYAPVEVWFNTTQSPD